MAQTIKINPDKIKSVNASYSDMSSVISGASGIVADESQELLQSGSDAIKSVSQNIMATVESLNTYLNGVATAFEESDLAAANSIEKNTVATMQNGTKIQLPDS